MRFGPANGPQRSNGIFINFLRERERERVFESFESVVGRVFIVDRVFSSLADSEYAPSKFVAEHRGRYGTRLHRNAKRVTCNNENAEMRYGRARYRDSRSRRALSIQLAQLLPERETANSPRMDDLG